MHNQTVRHLPTGSAALASLLLLLGGTLLGGCAQQVKDSGTWQDNVPRNQPFTRVLVVGVSPNINQRCAFEQFMASRITSAATAAIASCDAMKQKEPLTREGIEQAVASQQADAVVATILVARKWTETEGGSRDTHGGGYYKATDAGYATGYYGVYSVPVIYGDFQTSDPITTVKGQIQVATKVWATQGPTLVYTLNTTAKNQEQSDVTLAAITASIGDRLLKEHLIR